MAPISFSERPGISLSCFSFIYFFLIHFFLKQKSFYSARESVRLFYRLHLLESWWRFILSFSPRFSSPKLKTKQKSKKKRNRKGLEHFLCCCCASLSTGAPTSTAAMAAIFVVISLFLLGMIEKWLNNILQFSLLFFFTFTEWLENGALRCSRPRSIIPQSPIVMMRWWWGFCFYLIAPLSSSII